MGLSKNNVAFFCESIFAKNFNPAGRIDKGQFRSNLT